MRSTIESEFSGIIQKQFRHCGMDAIHQYFSLRLHETDESGVYIKRDSSGNTYFISNEHAEFTLSGWLTPATLVATKEGINIVQRNAGLLRAIHSGDIRTTGHNYGNKESAIYNIQLQTKSGISDFALKYTYPILWNQRFLHNSGIVTHRILQLADALQPIPHVHFNTPILATHDMTVSPFIHNSVPTHTLLHNLGLSAIHQKIDLQAFSKPMETYANKMLWEMLDQEPRLYAKNYKPMFSQFVSRLLNNKTKRLEQWADYLSRTDELLQIFHFDNKEASIYQSVVSIEKIYHAWKKYWSVSQEITHTVSPEILDSITILEFGSGSL